MRYEIGVVSGECAVERMFVFTSADNKEGAWSKRGTTN